MSREKTTSDLEDRDEFQTVDVGSDHSISHLVYRDPPYVLPLGER